MWQTFTGHYSIVDAARIASMNCSIFKSIGCTFALSTCTVASTVRLAAAYNTAWPSCLQDSTNEVVQPHALGSQGVVSQHFHAWLLLSEHLAAALSVLLCRHDVHGP